MNAYTKLLHKSSFLVSKWGIERLQKKPTLRELMTVEELSLWDIMSVELALYLIPDGLAQKSGRKTFRQLLVPYLRPIKYAFWRKLPIDNDDCTRWPSGRTALFIGFTSYMARDVLQPVIDLMLRENELTPVLLTVTPASPGVEIPLHVHSVHRHRSKETVEEARRLAGAIRRLSATLTSDEEYKQIFTDEDKNLWKLVKNGVKRAFNVHASFILPDIIAVARHILTVHRPSVIVSIDVADPRTRVYSMLGASLGIPTVQIQSGPVDERVVEWRFLLDDMVVAQGEQAAGVFLSHGVPAEKIHILGSPRYDDLIKADYNAVTQFRQRFNIPLRHRTIVLASSYSMPIFNNILSETNHVFYNMMKAIFAAVVATPGITLIVKPHPLEDVAQTMALVEDHSRVVFAQPQEDIRPLICACDAFFTMGSTSTLDGLVLGKPTVCPSFPGWVISDAFVQTGAVEVPRSEKDIIELFREIAKDGGAEIIKRHVDQRNVFLDSVILNRGQGASRRIADMLNALVNKAPSLLMSK
jgi:hypothetical protein